ncbi:MAG: type VI secretion system protein TssA [Acidobacteria bacterium]|nr:type VI secretion system protein TssA [Acidobacteriota bacterium]
MSAEWNAAALLEPISEEQPCGENLEDSPVIAALDGLRLYGRTLSIDASEEGDGGRPPIDWGQVRDTSLEALSRTKDLRLLAYAGTALLRTDGLTAFSEAVSVAAKWLDIYWPTVYPLIDEDALFRRNALNCFADLMAVVDRLRRMPLVSSRTHGRFSLRDVDMALGQQAPAEGETRPDESAIRAAFLEAPVDNLQGILAAIAITLDALRAIEEKMQAEGGTEMVPTFDPLRAVLGRIRKVCQDYVGSPDDARSSVDAEGGGGSSAGAGVGYSGGSIRSREEAIRALDAVADFFKRTEPSSPIPLFVDRAKRLVSMDFLELLADIAPEAVPSVKSAAGLRDEY